jgi:dTMP kinase
MNKGKLIALEGGDSAGKSTQIKIISKHLDQLGLKYQFFHFPMYGHNEFSEVIAKFLQGDFGGVNEVDPYFVANIYAMDRFMFLSELNKSIEENDVVLLDRYVFSNLAYQGAKYMDEEESKKIKKWIYDFEFSFLNLPYPDLNIFLDVPIDIVEERLADKREGTDREYLQGKEDIHEKDLAFQSMVRDNYLGLEGAANYKIISCAERKLLDETIAWDVYSPTNLFGKYKPYIDFVLFNSKIS